MSHQDDAVLDVQLENVPICNKPSNTKAIKVTSRHDIIAWIGGMVFLAVMILAMMLLGGAARWDAISGHYHNQQNSTSPLRFSPEPYQCNETNITGRHGHRCYGRWYYWKLPTDRVTSLTRAIVWLCYSTHQISLWMVIYLAQTSKTKEISGPKFRSTLSWYNWALFAINAGFFLLHLGQTHWTYDGLAQDVSLAASEGAVILILAFIMFMEYRDRGFICLWPNSRSKDPVAKYIRLNQAPISLIRKYHGYLFCWATTFVFWYHPMENTLGHAMGFIHAGFLFLQGSLIYTKFHLNKYWRLLNEVWVFLHGSYIAYQTRDMTAYRLHWPLHFLGFGFLLAFTQIFSLPLWRRLHPGFRIIPPLLFLAIATALCGTGVITGNSPDESNFSKLQELFFIPLEIYTAMFIGWVFVFGLLWFERVVRVENSEPPKPDRYEQKTAETSLSNILENSICVKTVSCALEQIDRGNESRSAQHRHTDDQEELTRESIEGEKFKIKQALGIAGFLFIHGIMIGLAIFVQSADIDMTLTNLMFCFVPVYCVCWSAAAMFARLSMAT